jgi:hypothetical protein
MGIGDNIAGIMVRRVADLQKRDRDGKVQQQLRNRTGAGKSFSPKAEQPPEIAQNDTGALEEADRMLQEIRDMVQAATSERDAAWSQAAYAVADTVDQVPDDSPALPLSPDDIDTGTSGRQARETEKPRIGLTPAMPSKTFAQARALYFQNMQHTVAEEPPPEDIEAADAEMQTEQPHARPGIPDREGVGTLLNLVI